MSRLGFSAEDFARLMQAQAMMRGSVIGQVERLQAYARSLKKRCVMGVRMPGVVLTGELPQERFLFVFPENNRDASRVAVGECF